MLFLSSILWCMFLFLYIIATFALKPIISLKSKSKKIKGKLTHLPFLLVFLSVEIGFYLLFLRAVLGLQKNWTGSTEFLYTLFLTLVSPPSLLLTLHWDGTFVRVDTDALLLIKSMVYIRVHSVDRFSAFVCLKMFLFLHLWRIFLLYVDFSLQVFFPS